MVKFLMLVTRIFFLPCIGLSLFLSGCGGVDNARCFPFKYDEKDPGKPVSYEVNRYQINVSFSDVIAFYNEQLDPIRELEDAEWGEWQVDKIDNDQTLFYCQNVLNSIEGELGCIYVRNETDHTLVETVWYLSGDAGPWCEPDLSVIR